MCLHSSVAGGLHRKLLSSGTSHGLADGDDADSLFETPDDFDDVVVYNHIYIIDVASLTLKFTPFLYEVLR